jgi:hypothetical protein
VGVGVGVGVEGVEQLSIFDNKVPSRIKGSLLYAYLLKFELS